VKATLPFDLSGRVAVVTGGSGVLCGALARALGACGANVAVVGHRHLERAEAVVEAIHSGGGDAQAFAANVLEREDVERLAAHVLGAYGRVDMLINGAGGARPEATTSAERSFFDLDPEAIRWVTDLNLLGTIVPCQVFGRIMADNDAGAILNIASMASYRPLTRSIAYSAAKAAVVNFTQWLAVHIAQNYSARIRVNAIAPGFFLTEQNRYLLTDRVTGDFTARGRAILEHTPMGRMGDPEDLVGTAVWLCSDAARFVTGIVATVDGGFTAYAGV